MGWRWEALKQLFTLPALPAEFAAGESEPRPIDQLIVEMMGSGRGARVSRAEALSVPAVLRGRNLICGVATLPLVQYGRQWKREESPFLSQIDPDVANVVTLAQTLEDLVFDAISWWRVTRFAADGYPLEARHLDVGSVSLTPPSDGRSPAPLPGGHEPRGAVVYVDGQPVAASEVIRFDSPNPGLLDAARRPIRRALLLDAAAAMYADEPRPLDYFSPTEGADPADDDEIKEVLQQWKKVRKQRSTAYVPASLKYNSVDQPNPRDLQLVELQQRAALDIANALGLDPEDLGISTTSRTYQNATDRRQDRINDVLSPYMQAITDRLSMGDVTKRGHLVRFDLDKYLRADPKTRAEVDKIRLGTGTRTVDEVRDDEQEPPLPPAAAKPAPAAEGEQGQGEEKPEPEKVDASARPAAVTFADEQGPAMTFAGGDFAGGTEPAQVDVERRMITGLAVPYNKVARKYGLAFRFRPGSLQYNDVSRIKHLKDHYVPVGVHESVEETRKGPVVKLKVLEGPEGSPAKLERDQLLYDAQHGLYDGLSIGVDFSLDPAVGDVEWNEKDQVYDVLRADWRETSSTPMPAFDDARVTKVAASRTEGNAMKCTHCGQVHAEGVACTASTQPPANQPPANQPEGLTLSQEQLTALLSRPGAMQAFIQAQQQTQQPATSTPEGGLVLSADQVDSLIRNGQLGTLIGLPHMNQPVRTESEPERRQTVDPTRRTVAASQVTEPEPYRFDSRGNLCKGAHDFSSDIIAGLSHGDQEALERAQTFMRQQFDAMQRAEFVNQSDAATLNPNKQRPDLYVDQKEYEYPIWSAVNKGTIADATPFVLPKFNSSSGLVANHTENTEPTPGTFTATAQTITPSAVSGKVEISREAWDQGGNPQLSGLIWRQMIRAWFEALEAASVALLEASSAATLTITTAAVDAALEASLTGVLAPLQYVRGGFRMRDAFAQVDLYTRLIAAKDGQGRKLFPVLGPQNATGSTADFFSAVMVGGLVFRPAWALAATTLPTGTPTNSFLFDRGDVSGWATAPQRLTMDNISVAKIHLGIWGYKALAITDVSGVRKLSYDPV